MLILAQKIYCTSHIRECTYTCTLGENTKEGACSVSWLYEVYLGWQAVAIEAWRLELI